MCSYEGVYMWVCVCVRVCVYAIVYAYAIKSYRKFTRSFLCRSEGKCIFECRPQAYVRVCAF